MKRQDLTLTTVFLCLSTCLIAALAAVPTRLEAQEYHNIVNTRFNTVSNGPMQALVVDVANAQDAAAATRAVTARINQVRKVRQSSLQQEIDTLRRTFRWKGNLTLGVPDIVVLREKGRLVIPTLQKTRAGGDIQFSFPLSTAAGDGGWTQAQADELSAVRDTVYPALKTVYGDPFASGTVTVVNADNLSPIQTDPNALSGGVYDITQKKIFFAQYNSIQSKVLNLTQMMAIAFHGSASISYDAWERGMARAATLEVVRVASSALATRFGAGSVTVADPLWHALDRYELLNQPPLGNERFFPVAKDQGIANTPTFPRMLVPRLMMSGSAWLKVLAESPGFLSQFNSLYYTGVTADPTIKNNIPALRGIAAQAQATVEGVTFSDWYQRQYILDTSITPGTKLYALAAQLRPDTDTADDYAVGVLLTYYRTTFDAQSNSDEVNLNGTCYPIYWDYTFANRLFLAAQYERVDIRDGEGSVAPTFFNTIGGDPNLNGKMRIAMDFPINSETVRLYVAPRSMGTEVTPNNFWGTVVGADTGKMRIQTDTGVDTIVDVKQGAFGARLDTNVAFIRPSKATLTFTDADGVVGASRQVNVGYNEYIPVFYASDPVTSITHTYPAGPAMISFPLQPLRPRAEEALLNPTNDQPLFNQNNLLLAQWRQNLNTANGDNYLRYPSLGPLQIGQGYWSNFDTATDIKIKGRIALQDQDVTQGLQHGWNQIATPYQQPVDIANLRFQYLANNTGIDLTTAVAQGVIVSQNVPNVGQVAVFDFDPAQGYIPATTLQPFKAYWIRVLVSDGVSITYPNPTPGGRSARLSNVKRSAPPAAASGWSVGLNVRGPNGYGATAWLGKSDQADTGSNLKMNALAPPAFSRSVPAIAFSHPEWGKEAGDYLTDIRRTSDRSAWEVTVFTPEADKTYTLSWNSLNNVPRSTRLVLVDTATGQRQYLQNSSGYSFVPGTAVTRKFQILTEDHTRNGLRIVGLMARTTRGAGGASAVQIDYNLTQGATVTAEIRGADGRIIRHLTPGRATTAGNNTVVWDTRNDQAVSVAAGSYYIHVTARTPEGDSAKVIQPFIIVR